jgi:nucleoside-diphosphate-sugar epimerase
MTDPRATLKPTADKVELSRSGLASADLRQVIGATEPRLRQLAGASILVTGATGWFGVWLLDVLCAADDALRLGLRIIAVSRDPQRFIARHKGFAADTRLEWMQSDVRWLEPSDAGFDYVIHAATDTSVKSGADDPLQLFETIVDGTRHAIAAAGSRCKSFLLLSSGAIYGPGRVTATHFAEGETGGPDPSSTKSAYAEGKRAAEQLGAIAAGTGLPVRIARCFAFVGPHMPFDKHFAIGNFIADAVEGRPIRVKSDGRPLRSYLYMSDLMRALITILIDGVVARPYNVGSDEAITIDELAHRVNRVAGGTGVLIEGAHSDPLDRYVPDMTRMRTELGFAQQVSLDNAIAQTAAWRRAERNVLMRP